MRFRLKLDHDDVYFGSEELLDGEEITLGADAVVLDHAPDNAPGKYRWSRENARLEPLPAMQQKTTPGAPTLEQAFRAFLRDGADAPAVKAWAQAFDKTLDGFRA